VNQAEVDAIKREALAAQQEPGTDRGGGAPCTFLSTNDVLCAGTAELFTTELMCVYANMRGRIEGIGQERACNGERCITCPRVRMAASPCYMRGEVLTANKFCGYGTGELPEDACAKMEFSGVTNWCQLTSLVEFDGSEVITHVPCAMVTGVPLDFMVIFKADAAGTIGCVQGMYDTPSFQERMAKSTIARRVFVTTPSS
jgi:hypothetical protein